MKIASTHAEDHFLPADAAKLVQVRRSLLEAGHGRAKVAGCIDFLLARDHGEELPSWSRQAEYRKMLHELVDSGTPGNGKGRRVTRATPGYLGSAQPAAGSRRRLRLIGAGRARETGLLAA